MYRFSLFAAFLVSLLCFGSAHAGGTPFRRGDCNNDGFYDIADAIEVLAGLFSGATWDCLDSCDVNDDGANDISDGIYTLGNLFSNGPNPPAPFLDCGLDLTPDTLGCGSSPGCMVGLPPTHLDPGPMLLQSGGVANLDLPPGFFGPGSEPFFGNIQLQGITDELSGPFETGTTDTVIERLGAIDLAGALPPQADVAIELVELNLQSVAPITVVVDGAPTEWDVAMGLSEEPQKAGTMTVVKTHPDGGDFNAQLLVKPVFIFTRPGEEFILELPPEPYVLQGDWSIPGFCPEIPAFPGLPCFAGEIFGPPMQLQLFPAEPTPIPGAFIDPTAVIDPSALIGRFAQIGPNVQIGPDVVIGPNAQLGPNVVVGEGSIIGDSAIIGPDCFIGPQCVIDDACQLQPFVQLQPQVIMGLFCNLDLGVQVGFGTRMGDFCFIGQDSVLGNQVLLGDEVQLGALVQVFDQIELPLGAFIPDGQTVIESLFPCILQDGTLITTTSADCFLLGGFMQPHIPGFQNDYLVAPTDQQTVPLNPGNVPGGAGLLGGRVDGSGVAPANGGQPWVTTTHDCDDFADELEQALEVHYPGQATFTCIWEVNKNRSWWQFWKPRLINGHALTDLHHNGQTLWIEPQWSTAQGAIGIDMDKDGDGQVEYDTSPGSAATDGCFRIEVYDSRAACEAAGRVLD